MYDERLIELLERIAVALEAKCSTPIRTVFPWEKMDTRTMNAVLRYRSDRYFPAKYKEMQWPWSCEDLMEIGCTQLRDLRMFGNGSANLINAEMEKSGFKNWKAT